MAKVMFLSKTIEAVQLLREPQCDLHKDARTLLVLIDGTRHLKELKMLAAFNGVQWFDDALALLKERNLVQELPEAAGDEIPIESPNAKVADANLLSLDFALPPGMFDEPPRLRPNRDAPPVTAAQPAGAPAAPSAAKPAAPSAAKPAAPSAAKPAAPSAAKPAAPSPAQPAASSPAPIRAAPPEPPRRAAETEQDRAAIRAQLEPRVREQLIAELTPKITEELRARLLPEVRTSLTKSLYEKLMTTLRPLVEVRLRQQLEPRIKESIEREHRDRAPAIREDAHAVACAERPVPDVPPAQLALAVESPQANSDATLH